LTHAGSQSLFCKGLATIIKSSSDLTEQDMLYLLYEFFSRKETKTAQAFVFIYKQMLYKRESKKASSDTDYFKTFFHSDAYSGVAGDDEDAYARTQNESRQRTACFMRGSDSVSRWSNNTFFRINSPVNNLFGPRCHGFCHNKRIHFCIIFAYYVRIVHPAMHYDWVRP
jgi:hypothetical protein